MAGLKPATTTLLRALNAVSSVHGPYIRGSIPRLWCPESRHPMEVTIDLENFDAVWLEMVISRLSCICGLSGSTAPALVVVSGMLRLHLVLPRLEGPRGRLSSNGACTQTFDSKGPQLPLERFGPPVTGNASSKTASVNYFPSPLRSAHSCDFLPPAACVAYRLLVIAPSVR